MEDLKKEIDPEVVIWKENLLKIYPHMDEGFLQSICQNYKDNPTIFKELREEHQNGMHLEERDGICKGGVINDALEIGNNLFDDIDHELNEKKLQNTKIEEVSDEEELN